MKEINVSEAVQLFKNDDVNTSFDILKKKYDAYINKIVYKYISTGSIRGMDSDDLKQLMYLDLLQTASRVDLKFNENQIDCLFKRNLTFCAAYNYRNQYFASDNKRAECKNPINNCVSIFFKTSYEDNDSMELVDVIEDKSASSIFEEIDMVDSASKTMSEDAKIMMRAIIDEMPKDADFKISSMNSLCEYMQKKKNYKNSETLEIVAKEIVPFIQEFYGRKGLKSKSAYVNRKLQAVNN